MHTSDNTLTEKSLSSPDIPSGRMLELQIIEGPLYEHNYVLVHNCSVIQNYIHMYIINALPVHFITKLHYIYLLALGKY